MKTPKEYAEELVGKHLKILLNVLDGSIAYNVCGFVFVREIKRKLGRIRHTEIIFKKE